MRVAQSSFARIPDFAILFVMLAEAPKPQEFSIDQPSIDEFLGGEYDTPGLSAEEAVSWLAYSDLPDPVARQNAMDYVRQAPNTVVYAQELQSMVAEIGRENVLELAALLRDTTLCAVQSLGIAPDTSPPDPYTERTSWALWDMAKQRRLNREDIEATRDPAYPYRDMVGDAFVNSRVRQIIVARQVGWRIDAYLRIPLTTLSPIDGTPGLQVIRETRGEAGGRRNGEQQELNSRDLVEVGSAAIDGVRENAPRIPEMLEANKRSGGRGPMGGYDPQKAANLHLAQESIVHLDTLLVELNSWQPHPIET